MIMKGMFLLPVLFAFLLTACEKEKIDEVPDNIKYLKPCTDLADSLRIHLPEGENIVINNKELFADTVQKSIVLSKESEVFVTFIDEAASYRNTLCWYSFNQAQPPLLKSEISSNVVFPNISKTGEGGQLEPGHTVKLGNGKFPAGTVIGFYLVINGWQDGVINYNNRTFFTNYELNENGQQQHVLFKESYFDYILMGFEDMLFGRTSDNDFNDIIFSISDNVEGLESTSFDLSRVLKK